MGAAYYPVFEKQVKGFDPATAVSGKSLAKVMEVLDECARQIGVQPLSGFYSESVEESCGMIGEEVPADVQTTPLQWF